VNHHRLTTSLFPLFFFSYYLPKAILILMNADASISSSPRQQLHVIQSLSRSYSHVASKREYHVPYPMLQALVQRPPATTSGAPYPVVKNLNPFDKKRILVTGGAGFVGSHLVDRLMMLGHDVICLDNYFTGSKANVNHWVGHPNFELIRHDVIDSLLLEVDQIYHLACPASPVHYQSNPVKTLKTSFFGTYNMLGLAKRVKAQFLFASTSEVYGDPEEHPQKESYWGHVNCQGPRSCYDEGKRVGESLAYSYMRQENVDVRVARIFNTYGPRMNWNDGRVVSNFILQALKNEDLTIYGDGESTRSFQFVVDLVDGLIALMNSDCTEPVNLGNPEEYTIKEFADLIIRLVREITGTCTSKVVFLNPLEDDPHKRRPDCTRAKKELNWEALWCVEDGLRETIQYFANQADMLE
jgi:UDP-glucuronate decarboxylase